MIDRSAKQIFLSEAKRFNDIHATLSVDIVDPTSYDMFDYRCYDSATKDVCCTFLFREAETPVGFCSFIYYARDALNKLCFVTYKDTGLHTITAGEFFDAPCIVIGYTSIVSDSLKVKVALTKWFIALYKQLHEHFNVLIEICGQVQLEPFHGKQMHEATFDHTLLGAIHPKSATVKHIVDVFHFKVLDNIYEMHTLGPVYLAPKMSVSTY